MLSSCDSTLLFFPKHLRFLLREINRYVHTYRLTYILTWVINLTTMNSEDLIAFWAGQKAGRHHAEIFMCIQLFNSQNSRIVKHCFID